MSWQIPQSWVWSTMGVVADIIGGGTPRTSDASNFEGGDIPWITPADLSGYTEKYISRGTRNITEKGLLSSSARLMPRGTVLFSSRAPIGYVAIAANPVSTNQGFKSFVLPPSLSSGFIYYYLKRAIQLALKLASGTTFQEISGRQAAKIPVPIAPLAEQHRIVEAIESYLTRLDAAVALLERVQQNLKRYRASVLKAAVEGRLVPTEAELAKKEGRSYEPASELLKRTLVERRKKWIENAAEKARAKAEEKAHKAGKPWTHADDIRTLEKERAKAAKKYKEPAAPDLSALRAQAGTSNLPDLPEGWCWGTAKEIGEAVTGTTPSTKAPEFYGGDIPFFKPTDLDAGDDVRFARQYLTPAGAGVSRIVPAGSVLVTCIGATIGKTGLARVDCATNQQINALVPRADLQETRYLYWYFTSPHGQREIFTHASSTTLPILNKSRFEKLLVPVPPLAEQERITAEVERRISLCGSVSQQLARQSNRCAQLRQSILKWAFEGKLVPQDPEDEPASVLLERIKAERESMEPRKRRRPGRQKKNEPTKQDKQLDLLEGSNT